MKNHLNRKNDNFSFSFIIRHLIFIITLFLFNISHGQDRVEISGRVLDSLGQPIEFVTVVLFDLDNNYISNYRTQINGRFKFNLKPNKSTYILKFKSLAYKATDFEVELIDDLFKYEFNVTMHSDITQLDEVVVEAEHPVSIKKDTVSFKAPSFVKKNDDVLEDLLKNLPGLEVDEDGTVKVNGIQISKLLIGGDDIFDQNYKIATKSIDVNDIQEIEIVYNFNENSVLRTIIESEKIAINVTIKDEKLGAVYGRANFGYGNEDNYLADLTLFKLDKNIKTFLIGKTNTIGTKAQDNLNSTMFNRNASGNLENYQSFSNDIISTDVVTINTLVDETYINNNKSYFNSFHVLTKPKKNIHLRGIFYYLDDDIIKRNSFNANYKTLPTFAINQSKLHNEDLQEFNYELNMKNANGGKSYIEYNGVVNTSKQATDVVLKVEENQFEETHKIKDYYISQQVSATFKMNRKNALTLSAFFLQDKNPQIYFTTNPIIDGQEAVFQQYENPIMHFGVYSKLISNKSQWNFGFVNKDEKLNSKVLNESGEILQVDDFNFINKLKYNSKDFFVFREYNFSFGKNFNLDIKAKAGYNYVSYKDETLLSNFRETNEQFYIEPELELSKEINRIGKFNLQYYFSFKQPQISDIYNGLVMTSNRGFKKGLNSLFNLYLHRISLLHAKSDFRKNIFIKSSLSYSYNQNTFGYEFINSSDFDILVKDKARNNSVLMTSIKINKNINTIRSGLFFEYGGVHRRSFVQILDNPEIAKNIINNIAIKYGSYFRGKINFKSGVKFQHSKFRTKTIKNDNTQFSSHLQFVYDISDKLIFSLDTNQVYPSKYNGVDKLYNFVDFELKYLAVKNKLNIKLIGQNLANERSFQNSYVTLIKDVNTNIFFNKVFFNLSASYRF
ncbi:carboxypeptidase-like regulatory domain-containing protein [Winogradskyella marincola]|uniref:Carboxypeptidase-like regulatory domain-containing protein n=1 Tax=Winogradskyella marincola TaxID=3037795 RepID=A0ABT6G042_9FLAO|nr:carboxypeptidase-like regulatory domain-containing protein [Winogradskyella sp. YYF002]MDG4715416.1 carboxypeptidase-like regulatory domain-containing protein [Winogradskyella sp. YYF002]